MSVSPGQYLNTITENASRLGMRIQESFSEHTRDIALPRSVYLDADDRTKDIRRQLDSNSDREKLDALKRLIALISKGRNVSEYFAQVVKNVASLNLEVRKLVYIYLLRYAEQEPDLALLSINTFQKDLTDSNPLIRAMALRVLSGIKVPMIGNLVVLAIKKCAADISPYVRKNAALAIPKCYDLDSSHQPALIEILNTLLRDRSPLSIGGVAVAFDSLCPSRLDLLHQHYRRLCRILVDVDEWGQVQVMSLLLRYARNMLPRPAQTQEHEEEMDTDLRLLLTSVEPLLHSRNPAVILAVSRVYFYAAPPSYMAKCVNPLLRLLNVSMEVQRVVLAHLVVISRSCSNYFAPFYTRFLICTDDLRQVKKDKIKLLIRVITIDTWAAILREFIDYADDPDNLIVTEAIHGIGSCARQVPESVQQCLAALVNMVKTGHDVIISSAILVLKNLIQMQLSSPAPLGNFASTSQSSPISIIASLARKIDDIKHAQARACVIWLVGQYAASEGPNQKVEGVSDWAPDVLRKVVKSFHEEASVVKLQALTLASKLFVLNPVDHTLGLLAQYVFSLARYDLSYDVRDRGRMLSALLSGFSQKPSSSSLLDGTTGSERESRGGVVLRREQVKLVLFEGKFEVAEPELDGQGDDKIILGTLSSIALRPPPLETLAYVPDWLEQGVESSLRDSEDPVPTPGVFVAPVALSSQQLAASKSAVATPIVLTPGGGSSPQPGGSGGKGSWKDLDKFYEDTAEGEEEGEDDDEEEDDDDDDDDGDDENDEDEVEGQGEEPDGTGSSSSEEDGEDENSETDKLLQSLNHH